MIALFMSVLLPLVPQPQEFVPGEGRCPASVSVESRADDALPSEGYRLEIMSNAVVAVASDPAGFFYAKQTLRQLRSAGDGTLPCGVISDAPKFPWRGLMLDESRHFFGRETVLKLLDAMAEFKLNVLHWHLTDNQGWRIPIPGYPELTRTVRPAENRTNFRDIVSGVVPPAAYTRDELEEVVRRARELHIRIVPEIEIPGHSKVVLTVEHELGCFPPQEFAGGGPADKVRDVLCPGRDATLRFYERVLDEVCEIFPDSVVHIGGDECDRSNWKRCPRCQERMRKEGLRDVAELQAWTTAHFARYLASKGRRLMGWDEIAEGGLPASAMVMSWRGISTGVVAAKGGHDVVMTPNEFCYFDYEQCIEGDGRRYPVNWTVPLPLAKVYSFDPLRGIPSEFHRHVLGAQGNNWTEMTCTRDELEWKVWPRAAALAEVLWSYPKRRDFGAFASRMEICRKRLVADGISAAPVLPRIDRVHGELTRTGDRIEYVSGSTRASVEIVSGDLVVTVNGRRLRTFKKDGCFVELEVIETGKGGFLVTARRDTSEIVAVIRFDGERVVARERWDSIGNG